MAHSWRPGQAVLWDNRRFLHSTTPVEIYAAGPRLMWQIIHRTDVGRDPTALFSVRIHGHPGADEPGGGAGVIGAGETKTGQQSQNGAGSGLDEAQRKAKAKL
jgi:hypothetical protein